MTFIFIVSTALTVYILCGCSHYIVPELGSDIEFSYASHKAVQEYKEAKGVSIAGSGKDCMIYFTSEMPINLS